MPKDEDAAASRPHHHHVSVQADAAVSLGVYANMMMVSHRKEEFVLDFLFVPPQPAGTAGATATLRTRVIVTPEHAKRIVRALHDNVHRYEASFGAISEATDLPTSVH
jgi:hypothetical protein